MVPGFCLCRSPRQNPHMNLEDNKLIGNPLGAPIKSSCPLALIFQALFYASTLGFTHDATLNPAIIHTSTPLSLPLWVSTMAKIFTGSQSHIWRYPKS